MTATVLHDHGGTARAVRWGIVSAGHIAGAIATDLAELDDGVALAVASRDVERARAFAARHGIERAYGSYAEMLADDDVDVVYVATPHRQHHAVTRAALLAGKSALVEKAFTVTLDGTRDLIDVARSQGLFVMEAMWTRFVPLIAHLRDLLADGIIGEVRSVRADLGSALTMDPTDRFWDPGQGGGALLDMGVYPVSFAQMLLGDPVRVQVSGTVATTGVDAEVALLLEYAGGAHALLESSLISELPGAASIIGTRGRIDLAARFHHSERLVVHRPGVDALVIDATGPLAPLGRGYAHELREVHDCLRAGRLESTVMPWADTVATMATMEQALHSLGLRHTEDTAVG